MQRFEFEIDVCAELLAQTMGTDQRRWRKPVLYGLERALDILPVDQYARDVSAFLMWAAEPHLEVRKAMGLKVMIFLIIFAGLVYYSKKKAWSDVAH